MGGEGRGCDHALPPPIRLHPRCKEGVSRTKVPCALLPLSCQAAGGTGRSFRRQDHDELLIRQNIRLHTGPARHNRECERPERAGMHLGDDNHQNNDQPRGAGRSKTAENSIGLISHGSKRPYQILIELGTHFAKNLVGLNAGKRRLVGPSFNKSTEYVHDRHHTYQIANFV